MLANHLKNEIFLYLPPYLLQHADNPVDWHPWGEEAFAKAKAENKPIFLSIGYAACHWCHVMAHESFEDPEIAAGRPSFSPLFRLDGGKGLLPTGNYPIRTGFRASDLGISEAMFQVR
jgi:hypothetical protein